MNKLSHFNQQGDAHMVNVGDKPIRHRVAVADGRITMQPETLQLIQSDRHKKGDVLGVARIAGVMGAKKTSELVPLCHPLTLTSIEVEFAAESQSAAIYCKATVQTHGQTGVEMEALTAVQVSLLTIYDMCKAVDRGMVLQDIALLSKKGGKSGTWTRK